MNRDEAIEGVQRIRDMADSALEAVSGPEPRWHELAYAMSDIESEAHQMSHRALWAAVEDERAAKGW